MFIESPRAARPFPVWMLLLLTLILLGNIAALVSIGLLPDEAYYWVWSQRLGLSYFDHPPLVAWLMHPLTVLFGSGVLVIRAQSVLSWLVGAVVAYDFARRLYGERRAGGLAVLVWASLPIVQVGFHILTPDNPLIIFTWLTYYLAYRTVAEGRPRLWLATGLCMGLALLAKYPAVVVLAGLFLTLLLSRAGRRQLAQPWPWLGALLALLLFVPVVVWNWRHDWISFAFQLGHGVHQAVATDPGKMFLLFLGGQLVAAMPWTFLAMAWSSLAPGDWRGRLSGYDRWLLGSGFWLPLIVFGIAGLTADSGPNWPETAYVPGTILLAGALSRWLYPPARARSGARPLLLGAVILLTVCSFTLVDMMRFPHYLDKIGAAGITAKRTQLSQSYGWGQVKTELLRLLPQVEKNHPEAGRCGIIVDNHATAGMVAWLLRAPNRVGVTMDTRVSQYHLWERDRPTPPGHLCLYMQKFDAESTTAAQIPAEVTLPEGKWRRIDVVNVRNPDLSHRWYAFYVPEAPGSVPAKP